MKVHPHIASALLVSSLANATDWVYLGMHNSTEKVEARSPASWNGNMARVWLKYTYTKPAKSYLAGDVTQVLYELNCATREYRVVNVAIRSKGPLGTSSQNFHDGFQPASPDSINEALLNRVCASPPKDSAAEWFQLGTGMDRGVEYSKHYVDKTSITRSGSNAWAWVQIKYLINKNTVKVGDELFTYTKFDCTERTFESLDIIARGSYEKSWHPNKGAQHVIPDSIGETELNFSCQQ
jgi:hypothetical protein